MAKSRTIQTALVRFLGRSRNPVYVIDQKRTIIFCNTACCDWLGVDAERLAGLSCDYHSSSAPEDLARIAASLTPPPDALKRARDKFFLNALVRSSGVSKRSAESHSMLDEQGDAVGVLIVVDHEDWTADPKTEFEGEAESRQLHEQLLLWRQNAVSLYRWEHLLGDAVPMAQVRRQAELAAVSRVNLVITGPKGSGKEFLANTIHHAPFNEFNDDHEPVETREVLSSGLLYAIDGTLTNAESLQGQVMTFKQDATDSKGGGPHRLLLRDVDQLSLDAQRELLGLLELPGFELLTVSTAEMDLVELSKQGRFDEQLARALSTLIIDLPALADRKDDIALIAQAFLEEFNSRGGKQLAGFEEETLDKLICHPWFGNLDELIDVVNESCEVAQGTFVSPSDLPKRIQFTESAQRHVRKEEPEIKLDDFLEEIEFELINRAMKMAKGNKTKAAQWLGITRARLHRRLDQLGESEATSEE